ncbi:hypothetical protein JCM13304A_02450 [Desulfothermus okinawensis JCM 13304]
MKDKKYNIDILNRIIEDCFWDYNISIQDLMEILESENTRELKKLFLKIIYNSRDTYNAMQLFDKDLLKKFFNDLKISYNRKYLSKKIAILRYLLFEEDQHIPGLAWKKY